MKHSSFLLAAASLLSAAVHADSTPPEPCSTHVDVFVTADFLYWKMHEEGLEFALSGVKGPSNPNPEAVKKGKIFKPHFKWDRGFRVGAGYIIPKRTWDIWVNWTRFHTEGKKSASHSGDSALNPLFAILDQPNFISGEIRTSSAKIKVHYDTVDLELGRRYEIIPRLFLRPQIGLRGVWINQDYKVDYLYSNGIGSQAHEQKFNNDFHGVGLRGGVNSRWYITPHFGIFGNLAAGLAGGRFHETEKFTETLDTITPPANGRYVYVSDHFYDVIPEVDLVLGLHLEPGSCKNRYQLEIDAGWEYTVWFNQNQIYLFTTEGVTSSGIGIRERGNLTFQGLSVSAKLRF